MGKILPNLKYSIIEDVKNSIDNNSSNYYFFVSNPVEFAGDIQEETLDDYSSSFYNSWNMLFGKKIQNSDIEPVIENNLWTTNSFYERYDNTSNTLAVNNNFYVVTEPDIVGGDYKVYKCIDNNNGLSNSTIKPSLVQTTSFETSDGYVWRYIYSITNTNYTKFSTDGHVPVYPNTTVQSSAENNAGVEVIKIVNGGSSYPSTNGVVQSLNSVNRTIQLETTAEPLTGYYTNCAAYIYNEGSPTGQLVKIINYTYNSVNGERIVTLDNTVNFSTITSDSTFYDIAPYINVQTDGSTNTVARCTVDTTSNSNTINDVIVLEKGNFVSWANVNVETSVTSLGSGAILQPIINSPGGHGSNPYNELNVKGFGVSVTFSGNETGSIITDCLYNKIGIIKDPYLLESDLSKGIKITTNSFSQVLKANTTDSFVVGDLITGDVTGSIGTVVFSNTTQVFISGDQSFANGETVSNSSSSSIGTLDEINTIADVYYKDIVPLYIQNINNVNRDINQSETYKLIITI